MYKFMFLLMFSFSVASESLTVEFGVYTKHLTDIDYSDLNEDNNLIAIEYNIEKWYMNASIFKNTFNDNSMSIGSGYNIWSKYNFNLDVLWGIVGGYKEGDLKSLCFSTTCLYITPRVTYSYHLTDNLIIKPSVKLFGSAFNAAIGLECDF